MSDIIVEVLKNTKFSLYVKGEEDPIDEVIVPAGTMLHDASYMPAILGVTGEDVRAPYLHASSLEVSAVVPPGSVRVWEGREVDDTKHHWHDKTCAWVRG